MDKISAHIVQGFDLGHEGGYLTIKVIGCTIDELDLFVKGFLGNDESGYSPSVENVETLIEHMHK